MGDRSQNHQEQDANPQLKPTLEVQDQAPASEPTSPAVASQRVERAPPSAIRPSDILALQGAVGNWPVQRMLGRAQPGTVAPGTIQRHMSDATRSQWSSARSQEESAIATASDGMGGMLDGIKGLKAGVRGMIHGFNGMLRVARAADAEPSGAEEVEGGE